MNSRPVEAIAILTLIAGAGSAAQASSQTGPWSLSLLAGDSLGMHGSLRAPIRAAIADLGALDPSLEGESGSAALHRLHYDDLFSAGYGAGLELGYTFDDALQAYGRFGYERLDGRARDIGTIASESAAAGELRARMEDVHDEALEVGTRYTWRTGTDWRPFAGVALGADRVEGMRGTLGLQGDSTAPQYVRFTHGDTVFSQSLETGVEYDPGNNAGVRLSIEADHSGVASNARDPKLLALGYDPGNDAQARWNFPVAIAATWRF